MTDVDHIQCALEQLLQERAELDAAITALQKRIGKPPVIGNAPLGSPPIQRVEMNVTGEPVVYRGEFFNLSVTKAAEKLLKRVGRPMKTPEIMNGLQRAGYELNAKHPRPMIYTSLHRSRDFVKVLADTWDLAERHPEAAAQKAEHQTSKATKKRKANAKAEKATGKQSAELRTVA
jgi:hypothetical protein